MTNPPYGPPGQPPQPNWGGQYPQQPPQPQRPSWGGQPQQQGPGWGGGQPNSGWQAGAGQGGTPASGQQQWAPQTKPPGDRNRTLLIVGLVVIALLIGLIGYLVINRNSGGDPNPGPGPSQPSISVDNDGAAASEKVMTELLTALSEGRATDALALIDTTGITLADSEPLLTDAVLAGNVGNFSFVPDFQVAAQGSYYTYTTDLTVAGETKSISWKVMPDASGQWRAVGADVIGTIMLASDVHVVVNGVLIGPEVSQVKVLPGSYHFQSHLTLLRFPEEQSYKKVFGGAATTFSGSLVVQPWVSDAVLGQIRSMIAACAASPETPGACLWEVRLNGGVPTSGTLRWRVDPADPTVGATLPTSWTASAGYTAVLTLSYTTISSGDCVFDAGGPCVFTDAISTRRTRFEINLSGVDAVVRIL